ncbi:methyltransferase domain-containing protein [Terrabacter sp. MAHUQ-38]|uniref:methyltransferase domain-containing protein n=1 Tax=unclassified Terrabacter TaxID=2630222 RepID=UPI00165E83F1|nr:methyltransferase domain-containing protein [Terrabacter sp. MAHUQ-38]MBC9822509.1 methyltransferase domain-containing protein [Terrabacter sp. MAHUQ-38]
MSHQEQLAFFQAVADVNGDLIAGGRVLEIGSYDVNGTVRSIFEAREYVGVDLVHGPGVDIVSFGHEIAEPSGSYDLAISGECFEHDPHWQATFLNMARLTRPGGVVAFTCASTGRPEHGTRRSRVGDSPGTQSEGIDYYRNLSEADFRSLPLADLFDEHRFWYMPTSFDLYFAGVRAGARDGNIPSDDRVVAIRRVMSLGHRALRLPLRVAKRLVPETRYQAVILPYWLGLLRIKDAVERTRSNGDVSVPPKV